MTCPSRYQPLRPLLHGALFLTGALVMLGLRAQPAAELASKAPAVAASRIVQVLVYPGGATVQRSVPVKRQARSLLVHCLPGGMDVASLQVSASAGIQLGEVSVQTVERDHAPECRWAQDQCGRGLEEQLALVQAEIEGHTMALAYLKGLSGDRAATAASLLANADAVRRAGQESTQKTQALERRRRELERELAPLVAERDRSAAQNRQWRQVAMQLQAATDGEVQLSYRVANAGWTPVYHAWLDPARAKVRLSRRALVAQSSGEDWTGAAMRLSTVRPHQAVGLPAVEPWRPFLLPPQAQADRSATVMQAMAAPAPAAAPVRAPSDGMARNPFDVTVFQGAYAAEYEVPGPVDVLSGGAEVALNLGQVDFAAKLYSRTQPQQRPEAYLLAEIERPTGSWPRGELQLFQDGRYVGKTQLQIGADPKLELPFGVDERVTIQVQPEQRRSEPAGFVGGRVERRYRRHYEVRNGHSWPVTLQLIEPGPAPSHSDFRVQAVHRPPAQVSGWKGLPGVVAWQVELRPAETAQFEAEYEVSYPKDARVRGLPE